MKLSSELKVALIGIATTLVLIWGVNYLKGRNVLRSTISVHAFYPESQGLEHSAPVLYKGVKIGYVDEVILYPGEDMAIEVVLHLEKAYPLSKASVAVLSSADLLGSKVIEMRDPGKAAQLEHHDTLVSIMEDDLFGKLETQLLPVVDKAGELAASLDSLALQLGSLLSEDALSQILKNLESLSAQLSYQLSENGALGSSFRNLESFTSMLSEQEDELESFIGNMQAVSADLDSAGLDQLAHELKGVAVEMKGLLAQVNSGEGNAGRFFYSDSLYLNLNLLLSDLDSLVRDLNEHPEDYVHISVFGKSRKEKKK
jgi:phospholipid/cholesterol/gamma-HCH transport system substrate-binding protein